ncbi:Stk1 family PASTA domain-containing Ser/Thr kinase [Ureibacillus chungkukjangi]|uniref:Serine/threonine-protein kinase PrkC n=1 Tax=Ureibacillus chungkukjangi TaxID=1202712 RepID=A0A318U570_9BACL|nr:Stk1 family PASTA domain-containing Ser/Thr kinase [Ureibacillus chungkukjangi]MCM3386704.1 Stk1 family PASTA domain-containing Ser/Thr kinase [Ureibacillus chungkukjangi]PYF07059.1 serine/threonine-protein kinase [Ureibacillus chungkukjangi]
MLEGKRLNDRYKILDLIGGGGMSNVYLAHDMILNRDVAVKILRYDATNEEEFHRRFHREALSATSLTHPNIVSIYDVGEDQDMHYIVMEYIKGKTLKQYINEFSPLSPARSVQIMKQLTSAITHAHENQIIHRDIKPQNILVDVEGNVKITDFGIATSLSATSYTKTNSVIGTVHYLSPEQARGGTATSQSDIYALGIVLYELLTGELPFSGESAVSIALKHLQAETPSIRAIDASIPQSLENVVLRATAKNPLHRYPTVEAMEEDLLTVLSPNRTNEQKFAPPVDDDETKAIPIIKEPMPIGDMANTKILNQEIGKIEKVELTKNKKEPKGEKKKKKSRGKIFGIILASLLIVILAAILLFNLLSPKQVEIPDVANLELEEAIETLETAGFTIGETKEKHSEDVEEGLVIETNPKAGVTRVEGTEITIYTSLGNETVPMDDYTGKQIDQVIAILENSDFKVNLIEEDSNENEGIIIGQEPEAGEEVIPGETEITLTVSKGKSYGTVEDLSGYNKASLKSYEQRSGFKVDIKEEYSEDVPAGEVIEQDPKANRSLELGGKIYVVVSLGPKEKESKLYVKTIKIPYEPVNLGDEQQVRIFIQDKTHTMVEPFAEFTITEDTDYKIELEITEDQPAAYRIERDAMRIAEETIPYKSVEE